jgi:hypothetical protein
MTTFCDRLSARTCLALIRRRTRRVRVLDPLSHSPLARLQRALLGSFGCTVEQAVFFAGHLTMPDGESVYLAARREASRIGLEAARAVVAASPLLRDVESQSGADRVALPLARRWNAAVEVVVMRALIARALEGRHSAEILLARPPLASDAQIAGIAPGIRVVFYSGRLGLGHRLQLAAEVLREFVRASMQREAPAALAAVNAFADGRPSVLMPAEDDTNGDPSYRRQPHWLPIRQRQEFASFITGSDTSTSAASDEDVMVLSLASTYHLARTAPRSDARTRLARAARRCAWRGLFSPGLTTALAHAATARLVARADVLAGLCAALRVRSFVCSDPYRHDADALQLCAREAGVTTFVFQYSHLAISNVIMATTADVMFGFSDWYAELWDYRGLRPARFVPGGYPFDDAFPLVRDRAARHRRQLADAGASFVIAYFDENVGPPSYGFIALEELQADLEMLAALVVADPTAGVVFKSQFMRNAPSARMAGHATFAAALATGRMLDLFAGQHRNTVLPCEAALTADVVVGHGVGGTAIVEAALAGRRGVLVTDARIRTKHDELYRKMFVTSPSVAGALAAIAAFRRGDPRYAALGDWSPQLATVDPFRDGRASHRLLDAVARATLYTRDEMPAVHRRAV